jgi:hypothetical protein
MLEKPSLTADAIKADIRSRVVFIVDRLLAGSPERSIQREVLKEFGDYPPRITYGTIQDQVEADLATRRVPRSQIYQELTCYRRLRCLALAVGTRIKATERIHKLLGIQLPDEMSGMVDELQMQPVKTYAETADDIERMVFELKTAISEQESKSTKPAEPSDPQLCEAAG